MDHSRTQIKHHATFINDPLQILYDWLNFAMFILNRSSLKKEREELTTRNGRNGGISTFWTQTIALKKSVKRFKIHTIL